MTTEAKLVALGEWDATAKAVAGGDLGAGLVATNTPWGQPVTITAGVVTWPAHGMVAGQLVSFTSPLLSATFTAILSGVQYVVAGTVNTNSFQLAAQATPTTVIGTAAVVAAASMVQGFQAPLVLNNDIADVGTVGAGVTAGVAVTVTSATPGVVSWASHGFSAGQPVFFTAAAIPTGLAANTIYYVSSAGLAGGTFQIAATQANALAGASSLATSSTGTTVVGFATNGIDTTFASLTGPTVNCAVLPSQGSAWTVTFNGLAVGGNILWVFPPLGGFIKGSNPTGTRTAPQNTAWNIGSAFQIAGNRSTTFASSDGVTYYAQHAA